MFNASELGHELEALKADVSQLLGTARDGLADTSKTAADALADQIKATLDELSETLRRRPHSPTYLGSPDSNTCLGFCTRGCGRLRHEEKLR